MKHFQNCYFNTYSVLPNCCYDLLLYLIYVVFNTVKVLKRTLFSDQLTLLFFLIIVIIIITTFFYLQVANFPTKPRLQANLSERIIRKQIAV